MGTLWSLVKITSIKDTTLVKGFLVIQIHTELYIHMCTFSTLPRLLSITKLITKKILKTQKVISAVCTVFNYLIDEAGFADVGKASDKKCACVGVD